MEERLTIGAFGRLTGLTQKALRHYDSIGLLRPASVEANGYRAGKRLEAYTRAVEADLFRRQRTCTNSAAFQKRRNERWH